MKADASVTAAQRDAQLRRLDGIATILAQTAAREPSLFALLGEDAEVSDSARRLKREMQVAGGLEPDPEVQRPRPATTSLRSERQVVPQSVVAAQLANPFLAPDFTVAEPARPSAAAPGRLGADPAVAQLVRERHTRRAVVHGAARTGLVGAAAARARADATPGSTARRCGPRTPNVPAGRRARTGQDRPGAAGRAGRGRLPAAVRGAQRGQDELGP